MQQTRITDIDALISEACDIYDRSFANLQNALATLGSGGAPPTAQDRSAGIFAYPEIRIRYDEDRADPAGMRAFARLSAPGLYATTLARPRMFRAYLEEQLRLLVQDYKVEIGVGTSTQEIPYAYVVDASVTPTSALSPVDLARHLPTARLSHIGDEVVDGDWHPQLGESLPLSLFDGLRTDFSLARLKHYTGTPAEHFQSFILFTNYVRYVDEFVAWALSELARADSPYTALSAAGNVVVTRDTTDAVRIVQEAAWRRVQMPAYHLLRKDGPGVTLVNIGVGPSNAKNICDHLAVLRPEAWLMIGHCGGLRPTQSIGDYVLAHAYLRDDHVLDSVLPVEIPLPAIAEVQQALFAAAQEVTGDNGEALKRRLRTGTVVTTDDRNWELRYTASAKRFNQSRAVAVDMESATIAAQGYRFRVPYGTLLCVSDKPLHGEIKLPGQANRFYEQAVSQHLQIGLKALDILRGVGPQLHSRKLRSFDEPPFR